MYSVVQFIILPITIAFEKFKPRLIMETLVWAVKNGDLDQVKEKLDDQVS